MGAKRTAPAGRGGAGTGVAGASITDVLVKLKIVQPAGAGQWRARCPVPGHGKGDGDRNPSLSITDADGKPLLYCHAGCSQDDVWNALGLPKPGRNGQDDWTAIYPYTTADGSPVLQVRRTGDKRFVTFVPDGGHWKTGTGVTKGLERPLYRLPEVLKSTGRVYFCEGEKDADNLAGRGLTATCNPFGALTGKGAKVWNPNWGGALRGRDVVALQDNDAAGAAHVQTVATGLQGVARSVRKLLLPGLSPGGDVSDWLAQGHTADELGALADAAPVWEAKTDNTTAERGTVALYLGRLTTVDKVQPEAVRWLWPGYLPRGKLTLLSGDPTAGKTFVACDVVARLTRGYPWPDGTPSPGPADVVLFSWEDGIADTLRPRLDAAGADTERVHVLEAPPGLAELDAVQAVLSRVQPVLFVTDPVNAFLLGVDGNKAHEVRPALQVLAQLAAEYGCAVLAVGHLNKPGNGGSGKPLHRLLGSIEFAAVARSILGVMKDSEGNRRIFAPIKTSLCIEPSAWAFELKAGKVHWLGATDERAADFLTPDGEGQALKDAADFLNDLLAAGPVPSAKVRKEAQAAGLAWRTVERAKQRLGVGAARVDGVWCFSKDASNPLGGLGGVERKIDRVYINDPAKTLADSANLGGLDAVELRQPRQSLGGVVSTDQDSATGKSANSAKVLEDSPDTWPMCRGCKRKVPRVDAKGLCQDCEAMIS